MHWLNELETAAPNLRIVPGHDGETIAKLIKAGWLQSAFVINP